jgi:hypothetical protein
MPKKSSESAEDWRSEMDADELAEYDRNPEGYRYDDSAQVSRDKQLVDYDPKLHQHQNDDGVFRTQAAFDVNGLPKAGKGLRVPINKPPNPEGTVFAKCLAEGVRALGEAQAECLICGDPLRRPRVTIVIHSEKDEAATFCKKCFDEKNVLPLKPVDGWRSKLSPLHLEVAERRLQNETQKEIAAALDLSQPTVSRLLKEVKDARKA